MNTNWSLIERISQRAENYLRLPRLVISIFVLVVLLALFDVALFIRGTDAAFADQVASTIAEFYAGTWEDTDCTFSHGYWKEHPDAWPVEEITIGGVAYPKEDALKILARPPKGDATYILVQQLIAARLNIERGADATVIEEYVDHADSWLVDHPLGSDPPEPDRHQGIALAKVLDLFNNGLLGPGPCLQEDGVMHVPPLEQILRPYDPEFPIESKSPTPEDNGGQRPVGNETPHPTPTIAPIEGLPPPTITPTHGISSSPTATHAGTPRPTPTPAPTQNSYATPTMDTPRSTPTMAPTMGVTATTTITPTEDLTDTPTPLPPTPTEYSGPPGCTHGMEYWINHPGVWSQSEFQLGDRTYDMVEALAILITNPQGDATIILAQQYIIARLNIASPADPTDIIEVLKLADIWILENPLGSAPKNPERKTGVELAKALEEYNLGLTGPGLCEEDLPTLTPTPTVSLTPFPTSLPSSTPTPTLSYTDPPTPTAAESTLTPGTSP